MPQFDEKHVKICNCTVVWDGITRPDTGRDGKIKYSLKLIIEPNNPDLALFQALAATTLQQSKFQGVLPAGGLMPVGVVGPTEFNGMFNGFAVVSAKSQFCPDVYDELGAVLDPMQYGPMIYGGQKVDALVHCYAYDKAGNRGISTGLDAFAIIASAQAPRQDFGGGGIATAAAFGGQPAAPVAQPVAPAPAPVYPVQPVGTAAPAPGYPQPTTAAPAPAQPGQAQGFMPPQQ